MSMSLTYMTLAIAGSQCEAHRKWHVNIVDNSASIKISHINQIASYQSRCRLYLNGKCKLTLTLHKYVFLCSPATQNRHKKSTDRRWLPSRQNRAVVQNMTYYTSPSKPTASINSAFSLIRAVWTDSRSQCVVLCYRAGVFGRRWSTGR